ncbi:MAG: NAD-dependent epimerase/dehydratase family protein [Phycisphaerales bacterium]
MSDTPTIIVTGAAGFIGSAVASALLKRGTRVVGVDNFDPFYPRRQKEENLSIVKAAAPSSSAWALAELDITDSRAMHDLFARERPEGVIHLAAKAGVRPSLADPAGYMRTNVEGTQAVLSAARASNCPRAVLASSSSVYGNASRVPFSELDQAIEPISPYAASKRACELLAHTHHHLTGMPTACLRFFTVFGPRQRPDLAISLFMHRIARGEPIPVFGDGSMSRDFTYVDDIVAGVLAAYDRIDAFGSRVWNLGHSSPVRLDAMISTIARVVGKEAKIDRKPLQPGDVDRTFADPTRSRAELGYEPRTPFEEGVERQWAWARARS